MGDKVVKTRGEGEDVRLSNIRLLGLGMRSFHRAAEIPCAIFTLNLQ